MTTRRPLPLALWLPALAVGVALFLVFVWPTPYEYERYRFGHSYYDFRTSRFTGRREERDPVEGWTGKVRLYPNSMVRVPN